MIHIAGMTGMPAIVKLEILRQINGDLALPVAVRQLRLITHRVIAVLQTIAVIMGVGSLANDINNVLLIFKVHVQFGISGLGGRSLFLRILAVEGGVLCKRGAEICLLSAGFICVPTVKLVTVLFRSGRNLVFGEGFTLGASHLSVGKNRTEDIRIIFDHEVYGDKIALDNDIAVNVVVTVCLVAARDLIRHESDRVNLILG